MYRKAAQNWMARHTDDLASKLESFVGLKDLQNTVQEGEGVDITITSSEEIFLLYHGFSWTVSAKY